MKALRVLMILAATLLATSLLPAQMDDRPILSVSIPFAFTVENTRLPAGQYIVSMVDPERLWKLSTADHKTNVLFHVSSDRGSGTLTGSQLVFSHYPTDYVLREIREQGRDVVAKVYEGKRGKQLAHYSASETALVRAVVF